MEPELTGQLGAAYSALGEGKWPTAHDAFAEILVHGEVPEALMGLASACYWLGELDAMIDALERAYAAAVGLEDPMLAVGAALSLVGYQKHFLGNVTAARGWLARARRLVEDRAPSMRGGLLGATAIVTDDPVESERLARGAFDLGRASGDPSLELAALTAVGAALVQQGRTEDGMAALDEAMAGAVGGECGDPMTAAHVMCMVLMVCANYFDIERATEWVRAMDRFVAQYGCPFVDAECRTHYGRVLFENGDWPAAELHLSAAVALAKGVTPTSHALASATLAELRLAQGRIENASRLVAGIEGRDEALLVVATLHLQRGHAATAADLVRRRLDDTGSDRLDAAALVEVLGRAEIALGRTDQAVTRGRQLIKLGVANDCRLIEAFGHRLLGHALTATDTDEASRHLKAAVAAFTAAEIPYRAAQTRLELASLSVATGAAEVAANEARMALDALEDLGAGREADAAAGLLRDLGVKAARIGPKNFGRLTKREQEVLSLLGEGFSNPEIAERLFIARKTVEHHVERVLAKLGVRSRAEAASLAARNG